MTERDFASLLDTRKVYLQSGRRALEQQTGVSNLMRRVKASSIARIEEVPEFGRVFGPSPDF